MSRTHHLTRAEAEAKSRATRQRAATRLTRDHDYTPVKERPANAGNHWKAGFNMAQLHRKALRKALRVAKVIGRRLARRRAWSTS